MKSCKFPLVCAVSGVLFLVCAVARAATLDVTVTNVEELTNALNVASSRTDKDRMTITLKAGIYDLSDITPMHANALLYVKSVNDTQMKLTIQGDPTASRDEVVIDAGGKGRALYVDYYTNGSVMFEHFTIRNGYRNGSGAALCVAGWSYFTFRDCAFIGNRGKCSSAIVQPYQGNWHRFYDCLFEANLAEGLSGSAGVVYVSHADDLVSGCRFIANTNWCDSCYGGVLRSQCTVTNCAFVGNVFGNKASTLGRYGYGGAVYASGGQIVDSVFTNNYAGSSTGGGAIALYAKVNVRNCDFYGNYTDKQNFHGGAILDKTSGDTTNAVISGCTFTANRATGYSACGAVASFRGLITNCTFVANESYYGGAVYDCTNVVDCVFAGNYSCGDSGENGGGAGYKSVIYDSVITNNSAKYQCGGVYDCRLYRCVIGGNRSAVLPTQRTQEAWSSYFEDCEMIGGSPFGVCFNNCGFNRCYLHDYNLTNVVEGTGYGYFLGNRIAVTNCLFKNIYTSRFISTYAKNHGNTMINSTLIDCTYDWLATDGDASGGTLSMAFVNNLFQGCKTRTWANDDDVAQCFPGMTFTNNFLSTTQKISGEGNLNTKADPTLKAKLVGDRDPERPYGPRHNSVLVGAGVVQPWMSDATDFDGHPRLTGGKVAIGAFESTDPLIGSLLLLR